MVGDHSPLPAFHRSPQPSTSRRGIVNTPCPRQAEDERPVLPRRAGRGGGVHYIRVGTGLGVVTAGRLKPSRSRTVSLERISRMAEVG